MTLSRLCCSYCCSRLLCAHGFCFCLPVVFNSNPLTMGSNPNEDDLMFLSSHVLILHLYGDKPLNQVFVTLLSCASMQHRERKMSLLGKTWGSTPLCLIAQLVEHLARGVRGLGFKPFDFSLTSCLDISLLWCFRHHTKLLCLLLSPVAHPCNTERGKCGS